MPRVTAGSVAKRSVGGRDALVIWQVGKEERTEETAADSKEDPDVDHEAETEGNGDV